MLLASFRLNAARISTPVLTLKLGGSAAGRRDETGCSLLLRLSTSAAVTAGYS